MIYIENTMVTTAKSADYLGNAGTISACWYKGIEMALLRGAKNYIEILRAIFPVFGAVSLFWWSFAREIPGALRPFIAAADAFHLMGA